MEILYVITVDCHEVESIQNELLIYVADDIAAIPNIKDIYANIKSKWWRCILELVTRLFWSFWLGYDKKLKENVSVPVIGNGDIISPEIAKSL